MNMSVYIVQNNIDVGLEFSKLEGNKSAKSTCLIHLAEVMIEAFNKRIDPYCTITVEIFRNAVTAIWKQSSLAIQPV